MRKFLTISILFVISIIGISLKLHNINNETSLATAKSINTFNENALTICIDPGHGDWDDGATGVNGSLEKDINLSVSLKLGKLLNDAGFNVVYTRDSDNLNLSDKELENLYERVNISEKNNADLFISIHCNNSDESGSYSGIETWYNPDNPNNETLASFIQDELSSLEYSKDRGIKEDSELIVLKDNPVPSTLIELGFLSNYSDENFLTTNSGQAQCAQAIFNAIKNASEIIFTS